MNPVIENIPDGDQLNFFIHHQQITYSHEGMAMPREAALGNTPESGDNKSCDWSEHATPEATRALLGRQYRTGKTDFKDPRAFFVYQHTVAEWRTVHKEGPEAKAQEVTHDPIFSDPEVPGKPNNPAHTIIIGDKSEKLRSLMARKSKWAIAPPDNKAEMKLYVNAL